MPDNWWGQFGGDYNTVNKNLGGLPDVVRKVAAAPAPDQGYSLRKAAISSAPGIAKMLGTSDQEVQQAQEWRKGFDASNLAQNQELLSKNKTYGNIVSGTQGAISGATMGAPEALQKVMGPGSGQELTQQMKQEYPVANLAGNIAGGVASSFALPGAGEALAAKGGYLAGKGLIPLAARSALNAATFAVPTAVTQGIATGDTGQTWHDLKQNLLYGTVGGVALGKILGGSGKLIKGMQDVADDAVINAAVPGASRILKNVAGGGIAGKVGATAEHIADLKSNLAEIISKNKLYGKAAVEDFTKGQGDIWKSVDDAFQKSGAKPSDFLDEILNHPDIAKIRNDPQYGTEVDNYIQNTLERGDALTQFANKNGQSALPDIRKILSTDMKNGFKSTEVGTQLKGDVADSIHDVIDGHFVPQDLKQAWPALKVLKMGAQRMEATLPKAEAGSPTAPRMILEKLLGGGEGGAIMGAASGIQSFDPSDPSSWANMGIRMAAGTVFGSMANKGMARLANQVSGRTAGAVRNLIGKIPQGEEGGGGGTAGKLAEFLGTGQLTKGAPPEATTDQAPAIAQNLEETQPQEGDITQRDIEGLGGTLTPDQRSVVNMQPNAAVPAPEHAKDIASATRKEQEVTPEQKAAAGQMLDPVREKIKQKLLATWQSWENPYKDDWDKFYKDAQTFSDNFNPLNQYTARIIGGKDYKDYLRSYNVALRLQTLGTDLSTAIAPSYMPGLLLPGIAKSHQARDELVNTLWTAMSGDLKPPSKSDRATIEAKLDLLRHQRLTPKSAKKKIMDMLQQDYNVRFDLLDQYGLAK